MLLFSRTLWIHWHVGRGLFLHCIYIHQYNFHGFQSLQWLRGWTTPNSVEQELRDIQVLFKGEKKG